MDLPASVKLDQLRSSLQGSYTTHGWDMVISYDLNRLNERFRSKWSSGNAKVVREMTLTRLAFDQRHVFDAEFRSPWLEFHTEHAIIVANVIFEVELKWKKTSPKPVSCTEIHDSFTFMIQCSIPQDRISGRGIYGSDELQAIHKELEVSEPTNWIPMFYFSSAEMILTDL